MRRGVVVRVVACALLIGVTAILCRGAGDFRGALCFKRLEHAERLYGRLNEPAQIQQTAEAGLSETDGILAACGPNELREMTATFFAWSVDRRLPVELRVDLSRASLCTATQAVLAAPSDYLAWLWLARTQAVMGQWDEVDLSLARARELHPQGRAIALFVERD